MEATEEELYRSLGFTFKGLNEEYNIAIPRVEAFRRHRTPARFGDTLTVRLLLNEKTDKMMKYDFGINRKHDSELFCSGYLKIVGLDLTTWKATPLPADLVAKVASALH